MSAVAIDALRVDLTRLLLSARAGLKPEADNARTTLLFRRCKEGHDDASAATEGTLGCGVATHQDVSSGAAATPVPRRKSPLPQQVARSCYTYAPLADEKPTVHQDSERLPAKTTRPPSPSHGDIDRRSYNYPQPRRRAKARPTEEYETHDAPASAWRDRHRIERVAGESWHRGDRNVYHSSSSERPAPARGYLSMGVGEAWSQRISDERSVTGSSTREEHRQAGSPIASWRGVRQVRQSSSSVPRVLVSRLPMDSDSPRCGSEVHEFLYRESRTREERLREKQEERDKELTFQPRLVTTKYSAAAARRRCLRGVQGSNESGAETEKGDGGRGCTEVEKQARFEMLYQDSKAQLLRVQEDGRKIPVACTFQPRLVSRRPGARERRSHSAPSSGMENEEEAGAGAELDGSDGGDDGALDTTLLVGEPHRGQRHHHGNTSNDEYEGGNDQHRRGRERREDRCSKRRTRDQNDDASHEQDREDREESEEQSPPYAERLHRGHDEQRRLWAKRRQARARLELKGCTFQPSLDPSTHRRVGPSTHPDHGASRAARKPCGSKPEPEGPAHERLYRAATEGRIRKEDKAKQKHRAETEGCTFRPSVNVLHTGGGKGSPKKPVIQGNVYDRLCAAAVEQERRKALRDKMPPPGCTFRPNVNPYNHKRAGHPRPWAAIEPPPPPASHTNPSTPGAGSSGHPLPPPPPIDGEASGLGVDGADDYSRPAASCGDGASEGVDSPAASICNRSNNAVRFEPDRLATTAVATEAERKVMYREMCFSPRRHRPRVDGEGTHERLHEMGDQKQRRRNLSTRDPSQAQREREEEDELKHCTFAPASYTKAYRGAMEGRKRPVAREGLRKQQREARARQGAQEWQS